MECQNLQELLTWYEKKIELMKRLYGINNSDDETFATIVRLEYLLKRLIQVNEESTKELEKTKRFESALKHVHLAFDQLSLQLGQKIVNHCNKSELYTANKALHVETEVGQQKATVSTKVKKKIPLIRKLTVEEFNSLSKYMKGRLSLQQVNDVIEELNKFVLFKYKLMATPRSQLSEASLKKVTLYKSQEIQETKGKYFCTHEDLREYLNTAKAHNSYKSISAILRHCKRVTEIRGPGSIVRYVITVDNN